MIRSRSRAAPDSRALWPFVGLVLLTTACGVSLRDLDSSEPEARRQAVMLLQQKPRDGHAHRARIKNLVAPLPLGEETVKVPESFIRQIAQALHNLRDEQNVTVKFIGYISAPERLPELCRPPSALEPGRAEPRRVETRLMP